MHCSLGALFFDAVKVSFYIDPPTTEIVMIDAVSIPLLWNVRDDFEHIYRHNRQNSVKPYSRYVATLNK